MLIWAGDEIQFPGDTVNVCPLVRVPETVGSASTTGALVITPVEAVKRVEEPTELIATTPARICLPML